MESWGRHPATPPPGTAPDAESDWVVLGNYLIGPGINKQVRQLERLLARHWRAAAGVYPVKGCGWQECACYIIKAIKEHRNTAAMSGTREWEKEAIVKEVYELSYRNMPDLRVPLATPTSSKISLQSFTRQIMFSTKIWTILTLKSVFVSLMPISSQYYAERPSQICNIFFNMVLI